MVFMRCSDHFTYIIFTNLVSKPPGACMNKNSDLILKKPKGISNVFIKNRFYISYFNKMIS